MYSTQLIGETFQRIWADKSLSERGETINIHLDVNTRGMCSVYSLFYIFNASKMSPITNGDHILDLLFPKAFSVLHSFRSCDSIPVWYSIRIYIQYSMVIFIWLYIYMVIYINIFMILSTFVVLRHPGDVQGPAVYDLVGDLFVSCLFLLLYPHSANQRPPQSWEHKPLNITPTLVNDFGGSRYPKIISHFFLDHSHI